MFKTFIIPMLFCLLFVDLIHAQDESSEIPKKEKKQTLSFEDELIEGGTQKPDLFLLFQKKNFNYNRLIKLRENFLPELRKSSETIQPHRSAN